MLKTSDRTFLAYKCKDQIRTYERVVNLEKVAKIDRSVRFDNLFKNRLHLLLKLRIVGKFGLQKSLKKAVDKILKSCII